MPEPSDTNLTSLLMPGPGVSEDCLFLDVIVPEKIFNITKTNGTSGYHEIQCEPGQPCKVPSGAPVLVWIYGGGYTGGSKTSSGNPASLIATSLENDGEGVVYVAMNYRLGLFVSCLEPIWKALANLCRGGFLETRILLQTSACLIKDWPSTGYNRTSISLVVIHPGLLLWENPQAVDQLCTISPRTVDWDLSLSRKRYLKVQLFKSSSHSNLRRSSPTL